MESAVTFVHALLRESVQKGDVVVDATVGNGRDTEELASIVGNNGIVFGFDVQQSALNEAARHCSDCKAEIRLIHAGHETMALHIEERFHHKIAAITFNLGYLPGGDKSKTTMVATTVSAIEQGASLLRPGGIITVVCYSHPEGRREFEALRALLAVWPQEEFTCSETNFFNQRGNPPVVFCVTRGLHQGLSS